MSMYVINFQIRFKVLFEIITNILIYYLIQNFNILTSLKIKVSHNK